MMSFSAVPSRETTSTAGSFAREQADKLLGRLAFQIVRTIKSHGPTEVHDLRVAIRRYAQALIVLGPCFPQDDTRKIRRSLKKIMAQAGETRDHDIALRLLAKLRPSESTALTQQLRRERQEAARSLVDRLRRWVRRNVSAKWRNAQAPEPDGEEFRATPVRATAEETLPRMAKDFFRRGQEAARENPSAEDLHRFRIAGKKLRYTVELFAPVYASSLEDMQEELKSVQTLLGDIQDCAVVRKMISRHQGEDSILDAIKKRQRKKTAQFCRHWEALTADAPAGRRWTSRLKHAAAITVVKKPPARSAAVAVPHVRTAGA
jgi:CHAD domain-containing protein